MPFRRLRRVRLPSRAAAWSCALAAPLLLICLAAACASGKDAAKTTGPSVGIVAGPAPTVGTETTVTLAGARCSSESCGCRQPGRDDEETTPPPAGAKRFEIRMSAAGGTASLDLSALGKVAKRPTSDSEERETCAYIDVPAGSTHNVVFVAKESAKGVGILPHLTIAEYGPQGPYWYDVVSVHCEAPDGGRCDRRAAEAWGVTARQRKRGRIDPCGSAVVTKLAWDTSGGQAERDGGLFRDLTVRFTMEVKKFATQFTPGSTECLPK